MKKLFSLLIIFLLSANIQINATNYYFSGLGNDTANTGLSPASPFKSIVKLNTLVLQPGDSILFRSGNTFKGEIILSQSGTVDSVIVFSSYGAGQKPVISGSQLLSGWTQNGNIYQVNLNKRANNFYVNNQEMVLARYPNSGFLQLDSATGLTGILDSQLVSQPAGYWDSCRICIRTCQWVWETNGIASYTPGQLTFINPTQITPISRYGYFLYNKFQELDTANEWYYNDSANVIYYFPPPGQVPDSQVCEVAVTGNGFRTTGPVSYIVINGLHFDKQSNNGVLVTDSNSTNFTISNCTFTRQFIDGVQIRGKFHHINKCSFDGNDGKGIEVFRVGFTEIDHNLFRHIGQYRNSGSGKQTNLEAIGLQFADSCHIHHNFIDSVGYTGIHADGSGHLVERNVVSHCMMLLTDGAPIKSYGALSQGIIIRNNIVSNSNGNSAGGFQANFKTPGIYFDFDVNNSVIENNTIYSQRPKGIFLNGGNNFNTVRGNVIYGTSECIDVNAATRANPVHDELIVRNACFGLDSSNFSMRQSANQSGNFTFGIIDSNYYFNPYNLNRCAYQAGIPPVFFDLTSWQLQTGFDLNTKSSFVSWTAPLNNSQLFVNASDTIDSVNLGTNIFLDLDSNAMCGTLVLQPFTSQILINTNQACATNASNFDIANQVQVYPSPADDIIHVRFPGHEIRNLKIYNLQGGLAKKYEINNSETCNAEISSLVNGIYILEIISKDGTTIYRRISIIK